MRSTFFLLLIGSLCCFSSCVNDEVYSRFHHIENGEWHQDSVCIFTLDSVVSAEIMVLNVSVDLTTNLSYPYRDIWLSIEQDLTCSLSRVDTLHCLLADEYGKWLGSGVGGLNQLSIPYDSFIPRDSILNGRIAIRQIMNDISLIGVEKVGIKLVWDAY